MLMGGARASTSRRKTAETVLRHGGSLAEARTLFPGAPEPWIDLSTGINPVPYPLPSLSREAFARLPEPEAVAALEQAAAKAYGVAEPALVAAAPGTQILIPLLPRLFPQASAAVLGPTYGEHAAAWAAAGARAMEVSNFDGLASADAAVLCNPNNPDGRHTPPEHIVELAQRLNRRGGYVIVDEAFADLEPPPLSAAPRLPLPGLIVLRSFGKTYGLAGLRLGFALADRETTATIRAALGPWPVSGAAVEIGSKALADAEWRKATAARLAKDSARLDALLESAGFAIAGGTRLFRLVQGRQAMEAFDRLGRAGLFVRRFEARADWLRLGLPGSEEQWSRLEAAIA